MVSGMAGYTLRKFYNITYTKRYTFHRQELENVFEQKVFELSSMQS